MTDPTPCSHRFFPIRYLPKATVTVSLLFAVNALLWGVSVLTVSSLMTARHWHAAFLIIDTFAYIFPVELLLAALVQAIIFVRYMLALIKKEPVNDIFRLNLRVLYLFNWFMIIALAAISLALPGGPRPMP